MEVVSFGSSNTRKSYAIIIGEAMPYEEWQDEGRWIYQGLTLEY